MGDNYAGRVRQIHEEYNGQSVRLSRITDRVFQPDPARRLGIVDGLKQVWQREERSESFLGYLVSLFH